MIFIMHIVGARPNFMKADPVIRAMEKDGGFRQMLVHTGQHYDDNMSKVFFDDLGIRKPDVNLDVRQTIDCRLKTEDGEEKAVDIRGQRTEDGGRREDHRQNTQIPKYPSTQITNQQPLVPRLVHRSLGEVGSSQSNEGTTSNLTTSPNDLTTQQLNNSTTRTRQIAAIERAFEPVLLREKPDWVFVYGDVNSTVACARVAAKHGVKIAHVEAGLRSFDMTMPEEVNRIETDQLAELLFVTEESGLEDLRSEVRGRTADSRLQTADYRQGEGEIQIPKYPNTQIATEQHSNLTTSPNDSRPQQPNNEQPDNRTRQIHFVGNTMIDTVARLLPEAKVERVAKLLSCYVARDISRSLNSTTEQLNNLTTYPAYALVTLHRPGNVDDPEALARIMEQLEEVAKDMPVLFPVHPRTAQLLGAFRETIDHRPQTEDQGDGGRGKDEGGDSGDSGITSGFPPRADPPLEDRSQVSGLILLPPLGYLDFLALQANAAVVITDSGGIQEETSYLGVPCLTVRPNTERPVTIEKGTNRLCKIGQIAREVEGIGKDEGVGEDGRLQTTDRRPNKKGTIKTQEEESIVSSGLKSMVFGLRSSCPRPSIPLWDGHAAERIVEVMKGAGGACETLDPRP